MRTAKIALFATVVLALGLAAGCARQSGHGIRSLGKNRYLVSGVEIGKSKGALGSTTTMGGRVWEGVYDSKTKTFTYKQIGQ